MEHVPAASSPGNGQIPERNVMAVVQIELGEHDRSVSGRIEHDQAARRPVTALEPAPGRELVARVGAGLEPNPIRLCQRDALGYPRPCGRERPKGLERRVTASLIVAMNRIDPEVDREGRRDQEREEQRSEEKPRPARRGGPHRQTHTVHSD